MNFPLKDRRGGILTAGEAPTLLLLALVALLVSISRRLLVGWDAPLWLDEVFTGAIAIQPTAPGLLQDLLHELGGPIYYSLMWLWEKAFGPGNVALRVPSFIFAVAAPLFVLLRGHPDRRTRCLWAALTALWLPGFYYFSEARAYSLLFLLGTVQAMRFHWLITAPDLKRASQWSGISAVLILTHYHGLILTALQGLTYLALHWRAAWRTWPAALLFLPVAGWMFFHLHLHFRFTDPNVAWQTLLTVRSIVDLPNQLIGGGRAGQLLFAFIAATAAVQLHSYVRKKAEIPYSTADLAIVGASIAAIGLVFVVGMIRPTYTPRYLVPFAPAFLLGVALWAREWERRWRWLPWLLVAGLSLLAAQNAAARLADPRSDVRWNYSWQFASHELRRQAVGRIIFFFDNPTAALGAHDPTSLLPRVGGFFFHREGLPMEVRALVLAGSAGDPDPNAALLTAADRPSDAIIWVYDKEVRGTLALRHPPRMARVDPSWDCRDSGSGRIVMLSCTRRSGTGR